MTERNDPPPVLTRDDFLRHGRFAGKLLAFGLTLAIFEFMFLLGNVKANLWERLIMGFSISLMPDLFGIFVGMYLGEMAAKCPTTITAFWRGAFFTWLVALVFSLPIIFAISNTFKNQFHIQWSRDLLIFLACVFASLAAWGSIVSGVAAIYVRDYYQCRRKRWIPQFTLREMLIIFTNMSVILSSLTWLLRPAA